MSINPAFFANTSGLGPQTGGFNPTPVDTMAAARRQQSSTELSNYALASDPRVRALSGLLATGMAGDAEQASKLIHNTKQGQVLKDISALAVGAGLIPGGSPVQLAGSVQQMIGTQGFTIGGNVGRGSPVFGGGAITDMMSKSVFDSVKDNFYDSVTGLPKKAAHGLDMTQMSDAMSQLTSRGAFRGMEIGDVNINEKGIYEFKQNEQKMEKVNKIFSDYAGMLKDAKQIFGDLPVSELTQNAERLVGASLREMGSVEAMRNRMANIKATSAAFGLNPAAVASSMMQMTDAIQSGMYSKAMQDPDFANQPHLRAVTPTAFGRVASDIAESATLGGLQAGHSSTAASNAYAAQGKYMPTMGSTEAANMLAGVMTEINSPRNVSTNNVLAAQTLLSTGKFKNDPKAAEEIQDLITEISNTGDIQQQAVLNQKLAKRVNEAGGNIAGFKAVYSSAEMMNMMSPEDTKKFSKFLDTTARSTLAVEGTKELHTAGLDYGLFSRTEGGKKNAKVFSELISSVDKQAQDALLSAVGPNGEINEAALDKAYTSMPGLAQAMPKEDFKKTIQQFAADPKREKGNLNEQLTDVMDQARRSSRYAALGSERESILAEERAVQSYLSSTSLGEPLSKEDFGTELMRGFFGSGKIDNNIVLESLKNKGLANTFDIKGDKTGLSLDEAGVDKLTATIGADQMQKIAKSLNIKPDDKAGLAKALSTSEGFSALQQNIGNAVMGVDKDGGLVIAGGDEVEKETKELETQSMVTAAERLLGEGTKVGGDLNTVEGREKYNKDVVAELTKNTGGFFSGESNKLTELSGKFKKEGYGGEEFESLRLMAQSNPNISKAIQDSANDARVNKDYDKYNELMTLDRELKSAGAESGKFLGVLELMTDGLAQIKLFNG